MRYPSTSKYGRRGVLPPVSPAVAPTDAEPGSEAKILAMSERAAARQRLWHPADATFGERRAA